MSLQKNGESVIKSTRRDSGFDLHKIWGNRVSLGVLKYPSGQNIYPLWRKVFLWFGFNVIPERGTIEHVLCGSLKNADPLFMDLGFFSALKRGPEICFHPNGIGKGSVCLISLVLGGFLKTKVLVRRIHESGFRIGF